MAVSVRDFASSNPRADYDAIVARFGTPQQIAASCLEDMDTDELLNGLRIKRKIVQLIAATAAMMLLLWFGGVIFIGMKATYNLDGYGVISIEEKING